MFGLPQLNVATVRSVTHVNVSGMFGLPLLNAATVRSVTHVNALAVYSRTFAPGEKPRLKYVIEQRITAIGAHILIGMYFGCNLALCMNRNVQMQSPVMTQRSNSTFLAGKCRKYRFSWYVLGFCPMTYRHNQVNVMGHFNKMLNPFHDFVSLASFSKDFIHFITKKVKTFCTCCRNMLCFNV